MADPLEVGATINYFNNAVGAPAPNPSPGVVTEVTGDNDYTVQVQNPNDSTRYEEHVGQREEGNKPARYIEPREGEGMPGVAPPPPELGEAGEL